MNRVARIRFGTVALLVLLALITLLAIRVERKQLTAEEAIVAGVQPIVTLEDTVVRDKYAAVAFVTLVGLFAFMMWAALHPHEGGDKAEPPARESNASGTTPFR
jgi:hypothetical protein